MAIVLTGQNLQQVTDAGVDTTNTILITRSVTGPITGYISGLIAYVGVVGTGSPSLTGVYGVSGTIATSGSASYTGRPVSGNFSNTFTGTAGALSGLIGVQIDSTFSGAGSTVTSLFGEQSTALLTDGTATTIIGGAFTGAATGGVATTIVGVRGLVSGITPATATTLINFDAFRTVGIAATDAYGFRLTDFTSGADPTNNYGIYVPALTKGTNKYEILLDNAGGLFLGGSAARAKIYHNGTDLIIDSTNAGTGVTRFKSDSSGDIILDRIGLGGSPITNLFWINYVLTTSTGRGALNFDYNYTGAGIQANILSYPTYSGTSATPLSIAFQGRVRSNSDHTGAGSFLNADLQFGTSATTTITQGTKNFYGVRIQHNQGTGTANTGGQINTYGIQILGFTNYAGVAGEYQTGIYSAEDIEIIPDALLGFNAAIATKSTVYMTYNAGAAELQTFIGGGQMIGVQNGLLGFYATAPTAQYATPGVVGVINAGGTNPLFDDTDYDGGLGGTAYTIGDVVAALKLLGFLAA